MNYVESTLLPGETLLLKARIHWIVFTRAAFFWLVAILIFLRLDAGISAHIAETILAYQRVITAQYFTYKLAQYQDWAAMGVALFGLLETLKAFIYVLTTEFAVTNERVIVKLGWIQRDTHELNINRVTSLEVEQSILGRVLNYGDVTVVGMGGSLSPIRAIVDPLRFRLMVFSEVEGAKTTV